MMCHFPVKKIKMCIHFQGVLAWRSVQPFNFCSLTFAPFLYPREQNSNARTFTFTMVMIIIIL